MKKSLKLFGIICVPFFLANCNKQHADHKVQIDKEEAPSLDYTDGLLFCAQIYAERSSELRDSRLILILPNEIDLANDSDLLSFGVSLLRCEVEQLQVTRKNKLTIIHYRPLKQEHVYRCFGDSVIINPSTREYTTIQMSKT